MKACPRQHYTMPTTDEVTALIVRSELGQEEERGIIVHKIDGNLQQIYETHPSYMSLQEWANVTMREFIAFLIQYRHDEGNMLLRCGRLFRQFVVDCYAAIKAWRSRFFRDHQSTLRAELYSGLKMLLLEKIMLMQ